MVWLDNALALLLTFASLAVGLGIGRWLRLVRGFSLADTSRLLLTVTQGLVLLAILGGLDQRPLSSRARLRHPDGPRLGPPHRPRARRRANRPLVGALALALRAAEALTGTGARRHLARAMGESRYGVGGLRRDRANSSNSSRVDAEVPVSEGNGARRPVCCTSASAARTSSIASANVNSRPAFP